MRVPGARVNLTWFISELNYGYSRQRSVQVAKHQRSFHQQDFSVETHRGGREIQNVNAA